MLTTLKTVLSKTARPLFIILVLSGILVGVGIYLLPGFMKTKLADVIQESTGRKTAIAKVDFSLFPLQLGLHDFAMQELNGQPFASFASLDVQIDIPQSIRQRALVIDHVLLAKPVVQIARDKKGEFNFKDLLKDSDKKQEESDSGGLFPLTIGKLAITEGKASWKDQFLPTPEQEHITPINLEITHLGTQTGEPGNVKFSLALSSGGKFNWDGKLGINPVTSNGHIQLGEIPLKRIKTLALPDLAIDLQGNELIELDYTANQSDKGLKLEIKKSNIALKNFQYAGLTVDNQLVKIPDANLTGTYELNLDKALTLTIKQNKLAVNQIEYHDAAQGMDLKIPAITLEGDYEINQAEKDLKIAIKQHKLVVSNAAFVEKIQGIDLKIPDITLAGDYEINQAEKDLKVSLKQNKLTVNNVGFSEKAQGINLKIPGMTLEGDYDINQAEKNLTVAINSNKLQLRDLDVTADQPGRIRVNLPNLSLEGQYKIAQSEQKLDVTANNGKVTLQNLQLNEQGQTAPLVKIPTIGLDGISFDLDKQQIVVNTASTDNAEIKSWLDKKGVINYQRLFAPDTPPNKTRHTAAKTVETGKSADKPWAVQINNVAVNNYGIHFEDRSLKKPVTLTAKPINIKLNNISTQKGAKLPFKIAIGFNQKGSIQLTGDTVLTPLTAKAAINIKNIELEKFQPYVDKFARLDIIDGQFQVNGNLAVATNAKEQLDIKFKGETGIADLITRDQIKNKDLVKWQDLVLKNINADVLANQYSAEALIIHKPYARVIINKDKTINFKDILPPENPKAAPPVKTAAKAPTTQSASAPVNFKLNKVQIIDGTSDFADLSLILPFAAQIKSLSGGASNISSDPQSTINAELQGNAYDLAPVSVKGDIKPYQGDFDVSLKFDGMPMPLISSYMVQFAGYKIEKGKMTIGLDYKVNKGQLTASNNILIDQLELGEKIDNPDAVSLPLELAISLMKDSDGKIKIDVPISGSLEDPQFSIGHIIADALFNTITKIVTSPFRALGSLLGTDEDLSTVSFAAGSAELDKAQTEKLQNVVKALKEKSSLNLDIKGTAFQEQDWPQLSDDALYDQMKRIRADEINKKGERKIRPENVEISDDDYKRILATLFIEKFPLMAEKSFFGTPKLIDAKAGDFYAVAKEKMSSVIKPEPQRLKDLATERGKAIAKYLAQQGGIPNNRLFLLDSAVDPERKDKAIDSVLSLKVN